jgi:hypothetical protein
VTKKEIVELTEQPAAELLGVKVLTITNTKIKYTKLRGPW